MRLITEEAMFLLVSIVVLIVSILMGKPSLLPRLFFLPVWLWAIVAIIVTSYFYFDKEKIIYVVATVTVLIFSTVLYSYIKEKRRTEVISMASVELPYSNFKGVEFWEAVENLFFFPFFLKPTEEICDYNLQVIEKIESLELSFKCLTPLKDEIKRARLMPRNEMKFDTSIVNQWKAEIAGIFSELKDEEAKVETEMEQLYD
jgi:hypothetical protein